MCSEGSFTCQHLFHDMGPRFLRSHPKDPWLSFYCWTLSEGTLDTNWATEAVRVVINIRNWYQVVYYNVHENTTWYSRNVFLMVILRLLGNLRGGQVLDDGGGTTIQTIAYWYFKCFWCGAWGVHILLWAALTLKLTLVDFYGANTSGWY